MNYFLFLSLIFLISCVADPAQQTEAVRREVRYEPIMVTVEDNNRIQAICRSLASKEDLLNVLVSTGADYTFSYSQKNCSDENLSSPKTIVANIQKNESNFIFKTKDNETFGFSDVETFSKGVMKEICQTTSGQLMSPMQTSSSGALWFTTFTSTEHCRSDANGICIHLRRGTNSDGVNYRIHTEEWIKFKVSNEKRGFFIERKLISSANCSGVGTIEMRAELK